MIDALDRVVIRYDYDILGRANASGEPGAGERWMLNDIAGKPIRAWNSRLYAFAPNTMPCAGQSAPSSRAEIPTSAAPSLFLAKFCSSGPSMATVPSADSPNIGSGKSISAARSTGIRHCRRGHHRPLRLQGQSPAQFPAIRQRLQECHPTGRRIPCSESENFATNTTYDALNRVVT